MGKLTDEEEKMISFHFKIPAQHFRTMLKIMQQDGVANKSVFVRKIIYDYLKRKEKVKKS